jgi:hypothetical protein
MTDNEKVPHLQEMEMVLRDSRRLKGEVENLQRDLAQRTDEYEAKVDEVIRLEKEVAVMELDRNAWRYDHEGDCPYVAMNAAQVEEIAALQYQVQNQTLRADDAVAAYQICLRDYISLRDGTLTARRDQPDDFEQFTSGLPRKPAGSNMDAPIRRRENK